MVLRPRRALSSRQFVAVFAALAGGAGLVALFSFFQGNVYAPVFWLLDAAIVGAALRWCWRQGERREVVVLDAREVTITRAAGAGSSGEALFRGHPYWTRVVVEDERGSPRILLVSRGRRVEIGEATAHGSFFAPRAYELKHLGQLEREVFGPVLHVIRFDGDRLEEVVDQVNATGYGLTLGIHSRIDETVEAIAARARVGNCYVNRNQIGAVVGVQPFGGEALSGTGPKAGGPHYLLRFVTERTLTVNTTAAGGNASLLTLE
uniref:Aldehyde dehydrogenase family protein n=1 Tax=Coralloluteibacterium stylophorae TaxID=1776034 RepID=A0A8J8AZ48_9GAMM